MKIRVIITDEAKNEEYEYHFTNEDVERAEQAFAGQREIPLEDMIGALMEEDRRLELKKGNRLH